MSGMTLTTLATDRRVGPPAAELSWRATGGEKPRSTRQPGALPEPRPETVPEPRPEQRPERGGRPHADLPSRRHVQRDLHQLVRVVRAEIRDEVRQAEQAGDLDAEGVAAYRDLVHAFRDDLQGVMRSAGEGRGVDPQGLLEGVSGAIATLTDGLRAIRDARDAAATPVAAEPVPAPVETMPTPVGAEGADPGRLGLVMQLDPLGGWTGDLLDGPPAAPDPGGLVLRYA